MWEAASTSAKTHEEIEALSGRLKKIEEHNGTPEFH